MWKSDSKGASVLPASSSGPLVCSGSPIFLDLLTQLCCCRAAATSSLQGLVFLARFLFQSLGAGKL